MVEIGGRVIACHPPQHGSGNVGFPWWPIAERRHKANMVRVMEWHHGAHGKWKWSLVLVQTKGVEQRLCETKE